MSLDIGQILVSLHDAIETDRVTHAASQVDSPPIPKSFSLTERVLVHMMRENTGASILDSGGAYGRAWQRALTEDFAKREYCTVEFRAYKREDKPDELEIDVTIDLFSYLSGCLDYDRALTRQFERYAKLPENESNHYSELMQDFPAWIAEKRGADTDHAWTGNSYNEDNYLSGTVQYTQFDLDGEEYVLLQIHGGCDVRDGYTAPKVFRVDDGQGPIFGRWYQASIAPDWREIKQIRAAMLAKLDTWWDVGGNDDKGEACARHLTEKGYGRNPIGPYPVLEIESRAEWRKGSVCILPDHSALCPETGATLKAGF